ncbi:hypothetical protein [Gracilimonas mengyeensis]|uniref:Lipoprotein n=1 Tax=Gracilimonas mengyeensis TaxID=1302730 RepID=A0A521E163_9BACT|nr:hypothetical protein [Gracilimonas mengyeensis]SMO77575.1 hypothetical protein SAMN06265219_11040 [Gracilimonas mengyeensis]
MKRSYSPLLRNSIILLFIVILFSSCANVVPVEECLTGQTYGFWYGLLHGFIAPFSFIVSLFQDDVAVYAINNSGHWYDFGFLLGAMIIFGGGGKGTKGK